MIEHENNSSKALVFGSTGLVGSHLLEELSSSGLYSEVIVFNRRASSIGNGKVKEVVIDFDKSDSIIPYLTPQSHLFISLGTTIRKAGSVEKMDYVDRQLPVIIAEMASKAGVERMAVVSSIGANAKSRNYYLRIKVQMEAEVSKIPFERILIARPSMLLGDRGEFRLGEMIGKVFTRVLNPLMVGGLRKYRAIQAKHVAQAMVKALQEGTGFTIIESEVLKQIAAS